MKTAKTLPLLLAGLLLAASLSAQDVGEVVLVRNDVRGTPPGGAVRPLAVGNAIALGLRVETGADSGTRMTFDPQGALTVGARTKLTIDRATVDRATGRSDSALSVVGGTIRLALSKLFSGEVSVDTPTAVVGVKGTDFSVAVDEPTGATTVAVREGTVTVTSKAGGEVVLTAGQRTSVAPGQPPTPPAPIDPGDSTLTASAGGPAFTPPQETAFSETPLTGQGRDTGFFPTNPTEQPGVIPRGSEGNPW
ncbi:MAG TPA: FecR family protein [Thermoanaerobaculia bacterium]|nr:FecR family protein [Thermoanaerobaculia bacterium]